MGGWLTKENFVHLSMVLKHTAVVRCCLHQVDFGCEMVSLIRGTPLKYILYIFECVEFKYFLEMS